MNHSSFNNKIFKNFFYNLPAISFIVDAETGLFIDANQKATEFYGYSQDEFKNITIEVINPFTAAKETKNFRAKALKEGYNFRIFKHRLKNGEVRDVEAHISGVQYNNKPYVQAIIHDITEKKAIEDKLKESEELFRVLADGMQSGLAMYKDKFIYANPAFQNMLGYTLEELKRLGAIDMIAEEFKEDVRASVRKGLEDSNDKRYAAVKAVKKSGKELWINACAGSVKFNGETVRITSIVDITEMVNLRNSLEQEKDLLKVLIENINSAIALYNKNEFIYVNSAILNLFGYTEDDFFNMNVNEFFDIDENRIYYKSIPLFKIHYNNEISSRFIYAHADNTDKVRYLDLFRTTVAYNGERAGLAIFSDVTEQVLKERNILIEKEIYKELSEIDPLTGIGNRRAFDNRLRDLLYLAKRYGRPLSLIIFDIDRFKDINDAYGHDAGDIILKEIVDVAREELRKSDFLARYGGEEFMVIAPETPFETAKKLAKRLRLKIQNYDFKIGETITVSLGVTSIGKEDTEATIVYRADMLLYKAKENGRNRVEPV
ncbi:MAG: sensor domain-containing diguanylate cyclase [bacterium]